MSVDPAILKEFQEVSDLVEGWSAHQVGDGMYRLNMSWTTGLYTHYITIDDRWTEPQQRTESRYIFAEGREPVDRTMLLHAQKLWQLCKATQFVIDGKGTLERWREEHGL